MFYDKYCELCKQKGISPSAAAIEMGINKGTVSIWKSKGTTPQTAILGKIADYFGVSVDYLLGNDQKQKAPAEDEGRFKEGELIRLDADSMEILRAVRERPDMKILFSVTKNVTPEDLKKAIKIVEAFKEDSENM